MNNDELFSKVKITENGTVCLGKSLVCDGFEQGYHAAAFTHIHSDHVSNSFETCMHQYRVYTSKITGDLLEAITEDTYSGRTQFNRIDYDYPQLIKFNDHGDYLTLLESKHMLGSSQVFLLTHDKLKLLYSGDISPNDHPPKCDILVIDSTHGDPRFDKVIDNASLKRRMSDIAVESIDNKKPVCIHANRGQLQRIMHILSEDSRILSPVKFLTSSIDLQVAEVYNRYGVKIKNLIDLKSYEGENIVHGDYPWIEFRTIMKYTRSEQLGQMTSIHVSGGFGNATIKHEGNKYWIASNSHAEFSELLRYVREADPQIVVTDNYRTSLGKGLAERINEIGYTAKAMPIRK